MKYCTNCITPESAATIAFDSDGKCNICQQAKVKHDEIDWEARRTLDEIVEKYRGKGQYDCILPFSGGRIQLFNYGML